MIFSKKKWAQITIVVLIIVSLLTWGSQYAYVIIDLAKVYSLFQIFQSLITILALFAAGYWFILRRRSAVRLDVSQDIVTVKNTRGLPPDAIDFYIVRVIITITNKGEVVFLPGQGRVRVHQIKPIPPDMEPSFTDTGPVLYNAAKRTTINWTAIEQDDSSIERSLADTEDRLKRVEPGLTEQIYVDFIVPSKVSVIEVYSYVEHENAKFSCTRRSIHDLTKESKT